LSLRRRCRRCAGQFSASSAAGRRQICASSY